MHYNCYLIILHKDHMRQETWSFPFYRRINQDKEPMVSKQMTGGGSIPVCGILHLTIITSLVPVRPWIMLFKLCGRGEYNILGGWKKGTTCLERGEGELMKLVFCLLAPAEQQKHPWFKILQSPDESGRRSRLCTPNTESAVDSAFWSWSVRTETQSHRANISYSKSEMVRL